MAITGFPIWQSRASRHGRSVIRSAQADTSAAVSRLEAKVDGLVSQSGQMLQRLEQLLGGEAGCASKTPTWDGSAPEYTAMDALGGVKDSAGGAPEAAMQPRQKRKPGGRLTFVDSPGEVEA
jgi:hypothetical protein